MNLAILKKPQSRYISVDGIDGAGKTTVIEVVKSLLEMTGTSVYHTQEPGSRHGNATRNEIRKHVLSTADMSPAALLSFFCWDRSLHIEHEVLPALAGGLVVLSDRSYLSSIAYQGVDLDKTMVERFSMIATGGIAPGLSFVLIVDPTVASERISGKKKDVIEARGVEFQNQVQENFLGFVVANQPDSHFPDKFIAKVIAIDARKTREEVCGEVYTHVREFLEL
jgi:dTMP kinase